MSPNSKKQGVLNWKCLDLYVHNHTVNLETDTKTVYYSLLKLIHSPSIYLKHKNDLSKYVYASLNNKDHSLHPMGHMPCQRIIILHLWRFLYTRDTGHRGKKNHCRKHRTTALQVHVCFQMDTNIIPLPT